MQEKRIQSSFFSKEGVKVLKGTTYVIPEAQIDLGKGQFGSVKKIYDLSRRNLDLAVKIISKQKKSIANQAIKEYEIIEKLPYCINLVNYQKFCLESQNNYYFIMEYCDGGTLFDILQSSQKIFAEQEIFEFLVQFLNGYRSLLLHNIIHRDIKPQNILIHNGIYKICDFGFSKIFEKKDSSSDNEQIDYLQLSVIPGTPFFQSPEMLTTMQYNDKIDVFSLGIILFQMLFQSPNRIIREQQNKMQNINQKQEQNYPYFDSDSIKSRQQFYQRLSRIQDNQNDAYSYLDKLIQSSQIKRSPQIISLLKRMINIDQDQRISFEELFNHPLFKQELDKQNNDEYKYSIWNEIISDENNRNSKNKENNQNEINRSERNNSNDQSIYYQNNNQKENNQQTEINFQSDLEEISSSHILNIEEIQKQMLEYKISICEEMQKNTKPLKQNNTYYSEKRAYYQEVLSTYSKQDHQENQFIDKGFGNQSQDTQQNTQEIGTKQSISGEIENDQNLNIVNQIKIQQNSLFHNNENQQKIDQIEEIEIEGKDYQETFSDKLNQFISESDIRIQNQHIIKSIEDTLIFFRQVCFNYRKVACELSKSYNIIKSYNNAKRQADFIQHFDHISLLSLIMFKYSLENLKNNYNKILLDKSLFFNDNHTPIDQRLILNEEDIRIFQLSKESQLFIKQIKQDLQEFQLEFNEYLSKEQFNTIYETYQQVIDSHQSIKENYRTKISALIKQGIEEFGFLEQQQFSEFQKTLLYLTEIDLCEKNNRLYYQKYMFTRGNLLLRLEQIESCDNQTQQLSQYCERYGIHLVAQTD